MKYLKKAILLLGVITSLSTFSHDHLNLEHGVPLEIEDAYVAPYLSREFHLYTIYDRLPENNDKFMLVPRLEFGIMRNTQFEIAAPFEFGDRDEKTSRNIELEAMYNFNMESRTIPAISIAGGVHLPTGEGLHGYDTLLKLNLTKTLPFSVLFHRLHANIHWRQNAEPKKNEQENRMKYVLGYQTRFGTDDMIVADVVIEDIERENKEMVLIEVGWRHQFNPLTVIATGIGTGLNEESPDFRANISLQRALNLFY